MTDREAFDDIRAKITFEDIIKAMARVTKERFENEIEGANHARECLDSTLFAVHCGELKDQIAATFQTAVNAICLCGFRVEMGRVVHIDCADKDLMPVLCGEESLTMDFDQLRLSVFFALDVLIDLVATRYAEDCDKP